MGSDARGGQARGWILVGLGVLAWAQVSVAQDGPDFERIRKTDFDSTVDRRAVEGWVQAQFDKLFSAEQPLTAGGLFYRRMLEHFQARDATTGFKDGLAEMVVEAFTGRYEPQAANSANYNPIPAVVVLTVLKAYQHPRALACFKLGLQDPTPGVRLAAAEGLLASRITDDQWPTLLPDVQAAALKETDPVTLGRLCRVLTREGGPAVDQVVTALLRILDRRFVHFEQEGGIPAAADADVVAWLGGKFSGINDAQRQNEITRRIARLLADAAYAYVHRESTQVKEHQLERIIATAEKQLKAIATAKVRDNRPQPDVTAAMFKDEADRNADVTLECERWIGTEQTAGFLNEPPFNFPRGLNVKRAAPATQPASAPAGG